MRVRKIIGRSGVFERSQFPNIKGGLIGVHGEGSTEAKYCRILAASGDVIRFEEQALYISFAGAKGASQAVPDFVVTYTDGHHEIHEVKTLRSLEKDGAIERLRAIARGARQLTYTYRLVTDWEINREPRLSAAELICGRGRVEISRELAIAARDLAPRGVTLGDMAGHLGTSRDDLCALIIQGHIWIDLNCGLDPTTPVLGLGWRRGNDVIEN